MRIRREPAGTGRAPDRRQPGRAPSGGSERREAPSGTSSRAT
jgi:hypothetical protein